MLVSTASGGTQFGNSYLKAWALCPRYWFNTYYRPVDDADGFSRGIAPAYTKAPLLTGSVFHDGIAEWYRSGVRDGEDRGLRDLERALGAAQATSSSRAREYESEQTREEDLNNVEVLLRGYHDRFGPDSASPEFPHIRIACDPAGEPYIEREWAFELMPGYTYTCRTDAIIYDRGILKSFEHKTASAYGIKPRMHSLPMDSQFTGEQWILRQVFPDQVISGTLVNIVLKGRSAASKYDIAERETTTRTPEQLERWRMGCIDILNQIREACEAYDHQVASGCAHEKALDAFFPDHGTRTGHCTAYNGYCEFYELCSWAGREDSRLRMFRRRTAIDTEVKLEDAG